MPAMPGIGVDHATSVALAGADASGPTVLFEQSAERRETTTETLDLLVPARFGADAQEIVICAHIDGHSISESAMDNASGAATLLALAEHYQRNPLENVALRFLVFSAEEIALCGSDDYVAKLASDDRQRIKAVLNLDCVAGDLSFGAMTNGFDCRVSLVTSASEALGQSVTILNQLVRNSDHHAFAAAGRPPMRLALSKASVSDLTASGFIRLCSRRTIRTSSQPSGVACICSLTPPDARRATAAL